MKDRRSGTDMARRVDQQKGDRGNPFGLLFTALIVRLGGRKKRESKTPLTSERKPIIRRTHRFAED
jgi:hypothetical protein